MSFPWYSLRTCLLACALLSSTAAVRAQSVVQDEQSWTLLTANAAWGKRGLLYLEAQPRVSENDKALAQLLVRPAVGYRITPQVSLWQGYGWTPSFRPRYTNENRLFQQVLVEGRIEKAAFVNRTRLEERFIQRAEATSYRFRHLARIAQPLDAGRRRLLVFYDEYFHHLNSVTRGPQAGFDQNRSFVGVNVPAGRGVRFEVGYMFVYQNAPPAAPNRRLHNLVTALNFTL